MKICQQLYDFDSQEAFAKLSGDYNPMHLDPVAARREMLGDIVVHGVHAVMRSLEDYIEIKGWSDERQLTFMEVSFVNAIYLGQACTLEVLSETDNTAKLRLNGRFSSHLLTMEFGWQSGVSDARPTHIDSPESTSEPIKRDFNDLGGISETVSVQIDETLLRQRFPRLMHTFGTKACAELATLTRIVGMRCPGLQSIFSGFEIRESPSFSDSTNYKVVELDARFSRVVLKTQSPSFEGSIECFFRPMPERQISYSGAREMVSGTSPSSQTAWIIGGTRGVGEVTAKLVAASGGTAIITYNKGERDAMQLISNIQSEGGRAIAMYFDCSDPRAGIRRLVELGLVPDAIYYFASPKIFVQKGPVYVHKLFLDFIDVYVKGVAELLESFRKQFGKKKVVFFHPSSVALDVPVKGMAEYSAAKAAAEVVLDHLNKSDPNLDVLQVRLPRMKTDQTMTLFPVKAENAENVMLPLVERISEMLLFSGRK